ncbi:helix-turn-helix domain-containing protein [Actinoplanes sp. NPDC049265]|uniref:helix-turn-helix domain-containing protein n=1 Tax=Actinoplanes sp. NPDC049265 TaxID=3363902 RepID=UPI00372034C9
MSEFGTLLRGWRNRTRPERPGDARRTPGLRREELAARAELSVDYIVRLEQGRAHPSAQVVGALSRALELSPADTMLLHQAAGLAGSRGPVSHDVPRSIARLVRSAAAWPMAVYSADWWLLTWNDAWARLLGDPAGLTGDARNLIWYEFTGQPSRVRLPGPDSEAFRAALVADLRVARLDHPDDQGLAALIARLREHSADFARRWDAARAARHRTAQKLVEHPHAGRLVLDSDILHVPDSDLHVVTYSAEPGTDSAGRLASLVVP